MNRDLFWGRDSKCSVLVIHISGGIKRGIFRAVLYKGVVKCGFYYTFIRNMIAIWELRGSLLRNTTLSSMLQSARGFSLGNVT